MYWRIWGATPGGEPRLALNALSGKYGDGLFNNDEMAGVIKYHQLSEQNGGTLGPDAARVMIGALSLDSREIGGDIAVIPANNIEDEKDLEKADLVVLQGLIVHWSAVKTIDVDDVVDEAFIAKVTGWSYSRIAVIGNPESMKYKMILLAWLTGGKENKFLVFFISK